MQKNPLDQCLQGWAGRSLPSAGTWSPSGSDHCQPVGKMPCRNFWLTTRLATAKCRFISLMAIIWQGGPWVLPFFLPGLIKALRCHLPGLVVQGLWLLSGTKNPGWRPRISARQGDPGSRQGAQPLAAAYGFPGPIGSVVNPAVAFNERLFPHATVFIMTGYSHVFLYGIFKLG